MVRYMIEDTPLIKFLINNKPNFVQKATEVSPQEVKETSPPRNKLSAEEDEKITKSPEQSKSKNHIVIVEQDRKLSIQQLQLISVSGLQAHAKVISRLINDFYQRDKS